MKIISNKSLQIIVSVFLILSGWFYWFEYRPAQIRHDCSWSKRVVDAQPAVTKEDVERSQSEYKDCLNKANQKDPFGTTWCESNLRNASSERPAQPESSYYEKSTDREYDFCIHEKGLK